ncbi:MAG: hypothetical protein ACJA0Q_000950 [Saprospiraceae bacterium]|jgi:hypothetical protein
MSVVECLCNGLFRTKLALFFVLNINNRLLLNYL